MNKSTYPQFFPKLRGSIFSLGLIVSFSISPLASAGTEESPSKNLSQSAPASASSNDSSAATTANENLASGAKDDFSGGFKSVGRGFEKGTKVTGRAFKKAGTTVGRTFKKVGLTIKNWFTGGSSKSTVEERDLNESATQYVPEGELDAVGDEAKPSAKKTEKDLVKGAAEADSALN